MPYPIPQIPDQIPTWLFVVLFVVMGAGIIAVGICVYNGLFVGFAK